MEQNKIVNQNFLCSGAPVQTATVGIQALDISTGDLYVQQRVPQGSTWVVKGKYYFQTTEVAWADITSKPSVFPISLVETEIDFGTFPVQGKKFTITEDSITPSSLVRVSASGNVATDRVGDDWEWDSINFTAKPNTGTFTLTAYASGRIRGKRKIIYTWQ